MYLYLYNCMYWSISIFTYIFVCIEAYLFLFIYLYVLKHMYSFLFTLKRSFYVWDHLNVRLPGRTLEIHHVLYRIIPYRGYAREGLQRVTPADERVRVTPTDQRVRVTPADERVRVTPADDRVRVTPVDERVRVTPADERVRFGGITRAVLVWDGGKIFPRES